MYTIESFYIAALPFLINGNEKRRSEYNIQTMDYKLVLENSSTATVNTLPNTVIYLKTVKYKELKVRVQKIKDRMLYYGCKDSGLWCWKLKTLW